MTRSRRIQLRRLALRECAAIIQSALDADIAIFEGLDEQEAAYVQTVMETVRDNIDRRGST